MFNAENKAGETPEPAGSEPAPFGSPRVKDDIYVMPEKFHPAKARSANKSLVIVAVILVLVILASATYFIYDAWQQRQQTMAKANLNENQNLGPESDLIENQNTGLNGHEENADNANLNDLENTSTDANLNENINAGPSESESFFTQPLLASDADNDGLTDLEESAFGTSSVKPDTDGDGFTDGEEVKNGYNPAKPGSAAADKLAVADFVQTVKTNFLQANFQVLTLKSWQTNILSAIGQLRIVTPTGETIKIYVQENPEGLSAANWYLKSHPQVNLSQIPSIKAGDLEGIISPNTLSVYLVNPEKTKIYIFEYNLEQATEFRYPAVFMMTVKNLKLLNIADCKSDFNCFIEASRSCEPAKLTRATTINLLGMEQTNSSYFELKKAEAGSCILYDRNESNTLKYSREAEQSLRNEGLTEEEITQRKEAALEDYKKLEGKDMNCKFAIADLTNLLTQWNNGSFSSHDWDKAECSGPLATASNIEKK